jgi:RecA-family ATPase
MRQKKSFCHMDTIALRLLLAEAGFTPLPIYGKAPPTFGKNNAHKGLVGWQNLVDVTRAQIELWAKTWPDTTGTGILTKHSPALDIDVLNEEAAQAVEDLVRERYEDAGYFLVRFGKPPKRAILFRTQEPFEKIVANLVPPTDGTQEKIEFLADGQQVVVDGIHPDTKQAYRWHGGVPGEIKREDLPYIREEEAQRLVDEIVELLIRDFDYQRAAERPRKRHKGNGDANADAYIHAYAGGGGAADWQWLLDNIREGRELHDSLRDLAAKLIASSMSAGAAVNHLRALMDGSAATRDDRWRERYADIPRLVEGAEELCRKEEKPAEVAAPSLRWLDMSSWDHEPVPEREWAIPNRVPLKQAGLFSGEGGTGKSIIELTKNVAHVTGKDWLGSMPAPGPAIYVGAEDDEKELHIRLAAIAEHYGVTFEELIAGGLHVLCLLGQDATLCAASAKSGKVEVTGLYRQLYEAAGDIKPKNISIDTLSRAFAGSEIDRVQVYGFAMHMQALAMVAGGSVTVLSHPSLQGIATGTGISGSTAWHGAFRFRQYLKGVKPDGGEQPDNDLRELEFKKNQYGPMGEKVVARYQGGLFLPVAGMTSLDKAKRELDAEAIFLELLRSFDTQNRRVSDKKSSTYAPAVFAEEELAKTAHLDSRALTDAMRRLFAANRIWNEPCGRRDRGQFRVAIKA